MALTDKEIEALSIDKGLEKESTVGMYEIVGCAWCNKTLFALDMDLHLLNYCKGIPKGYQEEYRSKRYTQ